MLNSELYALPSKPHKSPCLQAQCMSQKKRRLKYKKYRRLLCDEAENRLSTMAINTDMSLKSTKEFDERVPTVQEFLDSPILSL